MCDSPTGASVTRGCAGGLEYSTRDTPGSRFTLNVQCIELQLVVCSVAGRPWAGTLTRKVIRERVETETKLNISIRQVSVPLAYMCINILINLDTYSSINQLINQTESHSQCTKWGYKQNHDQAKR